MFPYVNRHPHSHPHDWYNDEFPHITKGDYDNEAVRVYRIPKYDTMIENHQGYAILLSKYEYGINVVPMLFIPGQHMMVVTQFMDMFDYPECYAIRVNGDAEAFLTTEPVEYKVLYCDPTADGKLFQTIDDMYPRGARWKPITGNDDFTLKAMMRISYLGRLAIGCDVCGKRIESDVFMCTECPNYIICRNCHDNDKDAADTSRIGCDKLQGVKGVQHLITYTFKHVVDLENMQSEFNATLPPATI